MPSELPKNSPKKQLDSYVRFSAMGLQMGATIFIMTWLGIQLDEYLTLKFPVFTLTFALLSVTGVLYYFIKQVTRK
jgi:apolipoprotein N-acyltransferase